ncbi:hypothetical protein FAUST_7282 [Fusarium austroamericanum]|uniref:NB-ARC domain-containing protein n=1 Tax=Fusarium austroamericanum TaxID=282268 RepID=A0AAN6BYL7_FUSAU|nr:hypothetical protein FAUST_7282 [Fusarium austroamericanum]
MRADRVSTLVQVKLPTKEMVWLDELLRTERPGPRTNASGDEEHSHVRQVPNPTSEQKHRALIYKPKLCTYCPCLMNQATRRLAPPFSKQNALVHDVRRVTPLLDVGRNTHAYLEADLYTPRLDKIHSFLWLAGLPRPARPLHRQNLLLRTIYATEIADEHLVWHDASIFIKPMPDYLLDYEFWEQELYNDATLYKSAYGLLVSYTWLVRHKSDLRIASEAGLLPAGIHWNDWVAFVTDLNVRLDNVTLCEVNRRYRYGELRLSRLNTLYRLGLAGFSLQNVVYGFMSWSIRYTTFFERNFGWMLAVFVYVTVILSAMQVALATDRFGSSDPFQQFSYGLALLSIAFVFAAVVVVLSSVGRFGSAFELFLKAHDTVVEPLVNSLTIDIDGHYSTSTATFHNVPKLFRDGHPWRIPLQRLPRNQCARDRCLVLDGAFLGITPLYSPRPEDHKVDIIAISGLRGHAFGSFKERDGDHMWLRDSLPYDLMREDTADQIAPRTPTTKPIIFVAHSLGGLIVKQTLITLSKSKNDDDLKLMKAVYGIVFFGVPHMGMDISSLIAMVGDGPNRFLIESISHINSQIPSIQQREFYTALGEEDDSEIVCFYETEKSPTARKTSVLVPYTENPDFVNRSEVFEKLKSQLGFDQHQSTAKTRLRVSLFGLGGVGKTQVSLAYVYWLRDKCPDVSVFWVHASNEERFRQSYASIAEECDIPGRDDPDADLLAPVRKWLENRFKSRWLMVIDNADDAQLFFQLQQESTPVPRKVLGRYIPECVHESILITTRNKQAGSRLTQGKPPIEVGNMANCKASELIRTMLENNNIPDDETSSLSTRLENLPLAIAQAASFIHENCITINGYIRLLDESDVTLVECLSESFETVGRDSDTPHAVTATWIISFEQIQQQDLFTGKTLSFISLFDRQAIPRNFIANYWQKEKAPGVGEPSHEAKITKALGTLKAFCFVSELVARKWLVMGGKMTEFAQHALGTISNAYPYGQFETREVCLKYLPHAYAVLENEASYFLYEGRWDKAEQHQIEAVRLTTEVLGEEHPSTLTTMANLASIYSDHGRWKEAEELEADVMEMRKRVQGEEHPDTLTSINNLAITWKDNGRTKDALVLMRSCIVLKQRVLGGAKVEDETGITEVKQKFLIFSVQSPHLRSLARKVLLEFPKASWQLTTNIALQKDFL